MAPGISEQDVLAGLTDPQREAVTYGKGPLLIVAGAGSGKTRVITCRIAWLVSQGVPPGRILAITFTNKAADEMRRRVAALVGSSVYVSTFHSFCARLLRRHISRIGLESSFTIYDRADSLRMVRRIVNDLDLDDTSLRPADLLGYIGSRKDRVMGPEECRKKALGFEGERMARVYAVYQERLTASNALDFGDLLLKTVELFNAAPDVLSSYQDEYLYVLVDEYQDTNLPQHLIARALQGKHRNITAVGDPDQTIYTWRGARLENLMEFEEDFPGAHLVMLERNYRSSGNILRASNGVIRHNYYRRDKRLWTDDPSGPPVAVRHFPDSYAEARWVAGEVRELLGEGIDPTEIAVFYRTKQQAAPLEISFSELTLPCQVVDSVGFFDRRAVKDQRAYLQLLVNPRDDVACQRVINSPSRGIGRRTVERLRAAAATKRCSLMAAIADVENVAGLSARAKAAVGRFRQLLTELREPDGGSVEQFVRRLADRTDYVSRQRPDERQEVADVLDLFFAYARDYDQRHPGGNVIDFLEQTALVSDVDGWKADSAAVPLMTLHSAKGLEFDAVFLIGVEEDILPHRRALEEHTHGTDTEALEEERRLFYVGMTRARKRLFITCADRHSVQGRELPALPSRFLDELPAEGVDRGRVERPGAPAAVEDAAEDLAYVLKRKRITLEILDGDGDRLAPGVRVSHRMYGEGEIETVEMLSSRLMLKVDFYERGKMTMLLSPEDVAPADS